MKNKIISIVLAITVIASFMVMAMGSNSSSSSNEPSKVGEVDGSASVAEATTVETSTVYKPGDVIEAGDLKITYVSCGEYKDYSQYFAPAEGNKYVKFVFTFENIGSSDAYISSFDFDCFADDTSCEQSYSADDDLSATISAGRKTTGSVVFEVPKSATEIEVEYETNYWTDSRIVFAYA